MDKQPKPAKSTNNKAANSLYGKYIKFFWSFVC